MASNQQRRQCRRRQTIITSYVWKNGNKKEGNSLERKQHSETTNISEPGQDRSNEQKADGDCRSATCCLLGMLPLANLEHHKSNCTTGIIEKGLVVEKTTMRKRLRSLSPPVPRNGSSGSRKKNESLLDPTDEPIPGLFVWEDFLTLEEERILCKELDENDPSWTLQKYTGAHYEKRFGVDHDLWNPYYIRPPKHPLPKWIETIILPRLRKTILDKDWIPNEVNSISYQKNLGHCLESHVDDRNKHAEAIVNLSLLGDCIMTFTHTMGADIRRVLLKRRCLLLLTGKARYDYAHGINNQDLLCDRRVSVTMRQTHF